MTATWVSAAVCVLHFWYTIEQILNINYSYTKHVHKMYSLFVFRHYYFHAHDASMQFKVFICCLI